MPIKYSIKELQLLRSSPLVCKPEKLPPLEEWMGPVPDQRQKGFAASRGRLDDHIAPNELTQRRPTLDGPNAGRRASTAPEDIVLGPPKTAFASSRQALKTGTPDQADDSTGLNNRVALREKFQKEREGGDGDKREGRFSGLNNRRMGRDDREDKSITKPRRYQDQEDGDGRQKRNGDRERPRWERETRDEETGLEAKRNSREGGRREGRGKFEQPWLRGESAQQPTDDSTNRAAATKTQSWRRDKESTRTSDWERSEKVEQDPEWMDSPTTKGTQQAHTAEEFQRWKEQFKERERVKSGGASGEALDRPEPVPLPEPKKIEPPSLPTFLQESEVDSGMDKFFAAYGNGKAAGGPKQETQEVKAQRKPRFTSLFTPQPEQETKRVSSNEPAPPPADAFAPRPATNPPASSQPGGGNQTDQEHFQRILQMLSRRENSDGMTPVAANKPQIEAINREQARQPRQNSKSPASYDAFRGLAAKAAVEKQQQRATEESTSTRDTDQLLRLMQQTDLAHESRQLQHSDPSGPFQRHQAFTAGAPQQPSFLDRQNSDAAQYGDFRSTYNQGRRQNEPRQREPQPRQPPGFFDAPFFNAHNMPTQHGNMNDPSSQSRPTNLPPGMPHLASFDPANLPNLPGWPHQNLPSRMPPNNPMNPPPGIPNPSPPGYGPSPGTGPNSNLPPPHLMQHQQQQPPRRKYTATELPPSKLPFSPTQTGPPPPGFMNLVGGAPRQQGSGLGASSGLSMPSGPNPQGQVPSFMNHPAHMNANPNHRGGLPDANAVRDGMFPRHIMDLLGAQGQGQGQSQGQGGGSGGQYR